MSGPTPRRDGRLRALLRADPLRRGLRTFAGLPGSAYRSLRRRTLPPLTGESLKESLDGLPLAEGKAVYVQSSLASLGRVEGGAGTVVLALRDSIVTRRGGTLVMPCFSMRRTMLETLRAGGIFDVRTTPSTVGAIPEAFRKTPGVLRSAHPTHSVAALGPQARRLVSGHHACASTFGSGSPYHKLLAGSALLVGIGVSIAPCTFFHAFEDLSPAFPVRVYGSRGPLTAVCRDYGGEIRRVAVRAHDPAASRSRIDKEAGEANRRYLTRYLERTGRLKWSVLGRARTWIISAPDMIAALGELADRGITIYSDAARIAAAEAEEGNAR